MRTIVTVCLGFALVVLAAGPALAGKKLICTHTRAVGLEWRGGIDPVFTDGRNAYAVEIVSDTRRVITMRGAESEPMDCRRPWIGVEDDLLVCTDHSGLATWAFRQNNFANQWMYPPTDEGKRGGVMSGYGICVEPPPDFDWPDPW